MPEVNFSNYHCIACFNSTLLENMNILSSMDQYYKWIASCLRPHAGKRVLDIGCANGNLTELFKDKDLVFGADYSSDYITQFKKRFKKSSNVQGIVVDATDSKKMMKLKKYKFDTVISMNTFEHIKNDQDAFNNAYNLLEPKGKMTIIVPAGMWLYSILDFEGGHYRRYSKSELVKKMKKAGFKIEDAYYVNVPGALGWYFMHVLLKKRIYSTKSFKLFNKLAPLFRKLESVVRPPFGLSVVCVGSK